MKHRPGATKIDPQRYAELYYEGKLNNKEIAEMLNCSVSTLGSIRRRYNMPARDKKWVKEHWLKGKHHSEYTRYKISENLKGRFTREQIPSWKGGQYISNGYKMVLVDTNAYMREHRLVMSRHLNRMLEENEHVHHINGDKLDNRIDNLKLISNSEHGKIHQPKGSLFGQNAHLAKYK